MKKFKKEKGITLVALIITIVVLLILAAVAIGTVRDSDIIGHAQNAAIGYNQAKENEIVAISKYENIINNVINTGKDGKECYVGIVENMQLVFVIDYENKIIKVYGKMDDGNFKYGESRTINNVLENNTTPVYIKLDGEDKDVGTGGIKLELEESLIYYIKDEYLFVDVSEGAAFWTENLLKLDPNFDFDKLVE